jgi:NDP-sugar pyrophosphorylase family protein
MPEDPIVRKDGNLVILAGGISSRMRASVEEASTSGRSVSRLESRLVAEAGEKPKGMIGVGKGQRPLLDYLLLNARNAGIVDVVFVLGEGDTATRPYYDDDATKRYLEGLEISYVIQRIPAGRRRPFGTADALLQALNARKDWKNRTCIVCNSDNLYSTKAFQLLLDCPHRNAMITYDRKALEFDQARIERFAVIVKDKQGCLSDIHEKPTSEIVKQVQEKNGVVGVSMNVFKLEYDRILPFLMAVPLHPVRQEKELPVAVKMMVREHPKSVVTIPLSEHVPDLTSIADIAAVQAYLEKEFGERT